MILARAAWGSLQAGELREQLRMIGEPDALTRDQRDQRGVEVAPVPFARHVVQAVLGGFLARVVSGELVARHPVEPGGLRALGDAGDRRIMPVRRPDLQEPVETRTEPPS